MPLMNKEQLQLLGADEGAYSEVTDREATGDRSITLDRYEKGILAKYFDLSKINRRGINNEENLSERLSLLTLIDGSIERIEVREIPIVYPKREGNELRLYMQGSKGFYGNTGDTFVIYTKKKAPGPIVGFISPEFRQDVSDESERNFIINNLDTDDEKYQRGILLSQAGIPFERISLQFPRTALIARQALIKANYQCEYESTHKTFISPITKSEFMEAHHLIPLSVQKDFSTSLDHIYNIFSLCPNCHRKIHFGSVKDKEEILERLYSSREELFLSSWALSFEQLCNYYGITK
ncbi:HNH endonuclease signature motif containing protein [Pectobacterium brasiliense]|uniref:HNH endonuclease n=1 Tax=Pectobacterium brasiliense TaxID=180957 RepID=UPI002A83E6B5|nr:HNH endonuclease signature motif containing protein [Pectobacterium brasiliense]MDY4367641.1 HNH endonuclease signature motif containing protein [Pectobacterium brasiliense]MDY7057172.1 HNH endonuclease signature motif containing protein [Pectobacterium brasiliense]